ncbi:acyltransferase [Leuconostoc holzapfelii]|uniref:Acyltransferase n=1 Tax=Leuconostoc holzapfelii TaxID=434464 RepID=A0A846ZHR6_9LACO|nr:acyltransferase [Leuconostoc holzapfelii]NKZ18243.1 acyltransferase [Leuconostoc holzapfelii]
MRRIYGVDIARIMAMFMVVVVHNLNQGGVLKNTTTTIGFLSANELFNLVIVAVNIFALITGFVYSGKGIRLNRILGLYFEVLFLSISSLAIYTIFFGVPKNIDIAKSILPLLSGEYWYFNAYVGFVIVEPLLRYGINKLSRTTLLRIVVIMLLFSGTVGFTDSRILQVGYSTEWLITLFVAGVVIKKYSTEIAKINNSILIIIVVGMSLVSLLAEFVLRAHVLRIASYTSPIVIVQSLAIFILFTRIEVKNPIFQKILLFLSPLSFGVYILDTSIFFYGYILKDLFKDITRNFPIVVTLLIVILSSVMFFACFMVINYIRVKIFELLKVNDFILMITNFMNRKVIKSKL